MEEEQWQEQDPLEQTRETAMPIEDASPEAQTEAPEEVASEQVEETMVQPPVEATASVDVQPRSKKWIGFSVLAAVLGLGIIGAACAVTASVINRRWEEQMAQAQLQTSQQIYALQQQIQEQADVMADRGGNGVSNTITVNQEGMTPSQIYAGNVASVVAISGQKTADGTNPAPGASTGSGFVLTEDGYVVTNYHVVEQANTLTVTTSDSTEYDASLVGYDSNNDVAVLKIEAQNLQPVVIGSSDRLLVGDQVVAIGNPLGKLTSTLTVGYISAKDRTVSTDGSVIYMMQTDAAINAGNSGGPLFNMLGQVVGITTAKYSGSVSSGASIEGIGFAIPIDDVIGMLEDLKDYGYVTGAYLGVSVQSMDQTISSMYGLPQGSYVASVESDSCAQAAGIMPKDIITGLGAYPITSNLDLTRVLRKFQPGDETTVSIYRAGKTMQLSIVLDSRPAPETAAPQPDGDGVPQDGSFEEWYNYFAPFFQGEG